MAENVLVENDLVNMTETDKVTAVIIHDLETGGPISEQLLTTFMAAVRDNKAAFVCNLRNALR
jgi:hypothetical protein